MIVNYLSPDIMTYFTIDDKNEIISRIGKVLNADNDYSKVELESIIKKILNDVERRQNRQNDEIRTNEGKNKKPLSAYNIFIKEQIPLLKGTSVDRFRCASRLWKEQKDKK
jgi:hypothetical protein